MHLENDSELVVTNKRRCRRLAAGRSDSVAIDVDTEIFTCQNDRSVISKCHVETLCMLDTALEGGDESTIGSEQSRVEIVVVVGNKDTTGRVDADANWVISHTFTTDLTQESAVVAKYLKSISEGVSSWSNGLRRWLLASFLSVRSRDSPSGI